MSDETDDDVTERADEKLAAMLAGQDDAPVSPEAPPLILPVGLHADVSHATYCADPAERPSLSSSVAHEIAVNSPRHGWRIHPRLGGKGQAQTAAMGAGSLVHKMLLGSGPDVRIVEAKDWRTDKAKAQKKEALAAGHLPMLIGKYNATLEIVVNIHTELRRRGIDLLEMQREVTGIWQEEGALCRLRADAWDAEAATLYDVKFVSAAEREAFGRHLYNFGLDVQEAHYRSGMGVLFPGLDGRIQFKWIAIEQATGEIAIYKPDGGTRQLGDIRRGYALRRWVECTTSGVWPGFNDDAETEVSAPEFKVRQAAEGELIGGSKNIPF